MLHAPRRFSALLALVFLASCTNSEPASEPVSREGRPNVLVIMADDLGWADLGSYGASDAVTPELDALAADGLRMTQFYVASPMCSPSRASLLTGRYPARHGLVQALISSDPSAGLDPDEVLLPELLAERGYATGLVGKWHLGTGPEHHPLERGFTSFFGMLAGSSGYFTHSYQGTPDLWRDREPVTSKAYSTRVFSDEAIDFVTTNADEPWFLFLSYNAPHLADDRNSLPAPRRWREMLANVNASPRRRAYLAVVAAMDFGIGRVLAALETLDLADDTIVVFLSDNGPLPAHDATGPFVGAKDTVDEGGIRVPAIVRWPGQWSAGSLDAPVTAMDLTATLLGACGAQPPSDRAFDGRDLGEAIAGESAAEDVPLFWVHPSRRRDEQGVPRVDEVVRRGRWRLTRDRRDAVVLHDTVDDPGQTRDVAPENPELVAELIAALDAHLADVSANR